MSLHAMLHTLIELYYRGFLSCLALMLITILFFSRGGPVQLEFLVYPSSSFRTLNPGVRLVVEQTKEADENHGELELGVYTILKLLRTFRNW